MIISGKVIGGAKQGRTIGFPTANLKLTNQPTCRQGVYAVLVALSQQNYLGLAYYGPRYIFGEKQNSFEVFLFNFKKNIYGKKLRVKLLKFLRPPQQVSSLSQLKTLLEKDQRSLDQQVILVNRKDKILGIENKIKAHQGKAKLHRAVSVQLFNHKGELLIQQRSKSKRLFSLLWANTVCTDVRPYETCLQAASRRLQEEFGLTSNLRPAFKFYYSAKWGNGGEREIDQLFFGLAVGRPRPDYQEIAAWQYQKLVAVKKMKNLAPWFKLILKKIKPSDIVNS